MHFLDVFTEYTASRLYGAFVGSYVPAKIQKPLCLGDESLDLSDSAVAAHGYVVGLTVI